MHKLEDHSYWCTDIMLIETHFLVAGVTTYQRIDLQVQYQLLYGKYPLPVDAELACYHVLKLTMSIINIWDSSLFNASLAWAMY